MELRRAIFLLQNINGIGDVAIRKLIIGNCFKNAKFNTIQDFLRFIKEHKEYFYKPSLMMSLKPIDIDTAFKKMHAIEIKNKELGINYISYFDEQYPERFKKMKDSSSFDFPVILFYKGDINLLNAEKTCSIIGTRHPSLLAQKVGLEIAKTFANKGYVVISGLAEGCDTLGHRGCLDVEGKTVAIVGTGLDTVYPKSNIPLLLEILKKGGLAISEYPIGFKGASYSFVQRDRLQAAGADIVVPIQTSTTGGTMHAARASATKYDSELWVVSPDLVYDGDVSGNEQLIKQYFPKVIHDIADIV